jgi:hypothetical protein
MGRDVGIHTRGDGEMARWRWGKGGRLWRIEVSGRSSFRFFHLLLHYPQPLRIPSIAVAALLFLDFDCYHPLLMFTNYILILF